MGMERILSLASELPHAMGGAERKKENKLTLKISPRVTRNSWSLGFRSKTVVLSLFAITAWFGRVWFGEA